MASINMDKMLIQNQNLNYILKSLLFFSEYKYTISKKLNIIQKFRQ